MSRPRHMPSIRKISESLHDRSNLAGGVMVEIFHFLALFAIGAATVWAATHAFMEMVSRGSATVEDLLLLFIYLEIGAMVGIYFKTNRMPVRFLIYVAITALTRHMIGFVNIAHQPGVALNPDMSILAMAGAILLLSIALLLLRFGSHQYPSDSLSVDHSDVADADTQ